MNDVQYHTTFYCLRTDGKTIFLAIYDIIWRVEIIYMIHSNQLDLHGLKCTVVDYLELSRSIGVISWPRRRVSSNKNAISSKRVRSAPNAKRKKLGN